MQPMNPKAERKVIRKAKRGRKRTRYDVFGKRIDPFQGQYVGRRSEEEFEERIQFGIRGQRIA